MSSFRFEQHLAEFLQQLHARCQNQSGTSSKSAKDVALTWIEGDGRGQENPAGCIDLFHRSFGQGIPCSLPVLAKNALGLASAARGELDVAQVLWADRSTWVGLEIRKLQQSLHAADLELGRVFRGLKGCRCRSRD